MKDIWVMPVRFEWLLSDQGISRCLACGSIFAAHRCHMVEE